MRSWGKRWKAALVLLVMAKAAPLSASGGAHVIDDSEAEQAGLCHFETWRSAGSGSSMLNFAPACTSHRLPRLEIGGFVGRRAEAGRHPMSVGLAPKLNLRAEDSGLGIGLKGTVGLDARAARPSNFALLMPITLTPMHGIRLNLEGGWVWTRGQGHDGFGGAQIEVTLRPQLDLMAETFARTAGRVGTQAGLRWTVDRGRIDLDLLAGRYTDGSTRNSVTLGVTVRR
jgi:hypothetical protein